MNPIRSLVVACLLLLADPAFAQDRGSLAPKPLPPLSNPDDPAVPAKELFGRSGKPASLQARSIGSYARGCVAGAAAIPVDGATWQVMRLSRNRNWGHPNLIQMLQRLSARVPQINGWPGLLVGDISQPRGGPMITGHASHQVGLDADIWLTPMPDRRLTRSEREELSATDMVRSDLLDVDPSVWTPQHTAIIRAAAKEPAVARIFVNAAIKKALCRETGTDRGWLTKVRPMFGHNYHFHIRIACPRSDEACGDQEPPPVGDGCGAELAAWFTPQMLHPKPGRPRPPLTMAQLPAECRRVLLAP
ncbi:penicillin-insensitive murein endopeptidase [Microvirga brassicacearum]|uniref:Penicillin-insensitive murein endopeptidase n=1 Tax=Microvirga brassicacearum TaxID=2580413 RepID=A0A5N3PCM4_9HYPH|nr:penicillin-insensitive murein endopeptidase [Microvirga brassicacearum]KAB0267497.1 penicillin-insensitive murein endopeptidase [Microvirga brassicacearum]